MVDISSPVIISVSPSMGSNRLPETPKISFSIVDPGNPPTGIDQSTLNVYVKEHPDGGDSSGPIHVISNGLVLENTSWKESYFYSGNASGQVLNSADSSIEAAQTATLVLCRSGLLSEKCLVGFQ